MTTVDSALAHVAHTTPYAWPYDGELTPAASAAVVVRPASVAWPSGVDATYARAASAVVAAVRSAGGAVISVITTDPGGPPAPGEPWPLADAEVTSAGIDGFYASPLEAHLRTRSLTKLYLVGYGLETCVHSTMRSANDMGLECLLVVDACQPYEPGLVAASVSMIEMSGGIFGAVGHSADVVAALTARSNS